MASAVAPEIQHLGNHRWTITLRPEKQPVVNSFLGAMLIVIFALWISIGATWIPPGSEFAVKALLVVMLLGLGALWTIAALAVAWRVAGQEILRVDQNFLRVEWAIANRVIVSRAYKRAAIRNMRFRFRHPGYIRGPGHQTLVFDTDTGRTVELACKLSEVQVDELLHGPLAGYSQGSREL